MQLLDQLTQAAEAYELYATGHFTRVAGAADVLALPPHSTGAAGIVFCLEPRLFLNVDMGMPESTLRRPSGTAAPARAFVSRHDSPNRKRFSHSRRWGDHRSFRFDYPIGASGGRYQSCCHRSTVATDELLAVA